MEECYGSFDFQHPNSNYKHTSINLIRLTNGIEVLAFKAMRSLEGAVNAEGEFQENQRNGSRKKIKPSYLDIGAHIQERKKRGSGTANVIIIMQLNYKWMQV